MDSQIDLIGFESSPINEERSKYERGKAILKELTGVTESEPKTGYAAFAPLSKQKKHQLFSLLETRTPMIISKVKYG